MPNLTASAATPSRRRVSQCCDDLARLAHFGQIRATSGSVKGASIEQRRKKKFLKWSCRRGKPNQSRRKHLHHLTLKGGSNRTVAAGLPPSADARLFGMRKVFALATEWSLQPFVDLRRSYHSFRQKRIERTGVHIGRTLQLLFSKVFGLDFTLECSGFS